MYVALACRFITVLIMLLWAKRNIYCRIWRWAANCCAPITNQANCLCTWISHSIRSLLISFCWPKTTPIPAPIKSFAQNHMSNSFCCIMHSEAQCRKASRFIEWYGAFNFGRLTDILYNVPWAAPLWSICLQLAESMVGLFYRDELLPPFIVTWDDFLPVENKQNMTFNLVNNLFKIPFFCTSMNRVCNIEGESSRQVAWIYSGCLYPERLRNVDTTTWWKHIDLHERL